MQTAATALKLVIAAGLLVGLAACTTAPQQVPVPVASAAKTTPTPSLPASPVVADAPVNTLPDEPINNAPRPALLAGEPAREYQRGGASWYGPGFHGRRTASGERYDMHGMTAAHRTLPFGTWVRVHSLVNGREVDVRITDRGPFIRSRVIDLSRGAAEALGMLGLGFKEVVLLVPESTAVVVDMPLPLVRGRRGVRGR
ncbi:MAG: septal ring lytic transglycosylase RlpA family protein [Polaromonas sp.]